MKKLFFALLCYISMSTFSFAGNADVFKVDENTIATKFQDVNQLDQYVTDHEGVTVSEMVASDNTELLTKSNFNYEKAKKFDLSRIAKLDSWIWILIIAGAATIVIVIIWYIIWSIILYDPYY